MNVPRRPISPPPSVTRWSRRPRPPAPAGPRIARRSGRSPRPRVSRSSDPRTTAPRSPTDCKPATTGSVRNSPTSAPNTPGSKTRSRPSPASSTSWKWKTPSYARKARPAMSSVHCNDRPTETRPSLAGPSRSSTPRVGSDPGKQSLIDNTHRLDTEDHFRTDVSYLPDLTAYLDDLLRTRERLTAALAAAPEHEHARAAGGIDRWAAADAM